MSALPPKADIAERDRDVRFVPMGDIDQGRMSLVNGHSESRVTGLDVDAVTTRDRPERPPAPAC